MSRKGNFVMEEVGVKLGFDVQCRRADAVKAETGVCQGAGDGVVDATVGISGRCSSAGEPELNGQRASGLSEVEAPVAEQQQRDWELLEGGPALFLRVHWRSLA